MWKHKNFINLQLCATFKHFFDVGTIGSGAVKFRHYSQTEPLSQLATPQNVTANGTTVSWDEVENATSYAVLADGTSIGTIEAAPNLISFTIAGSSYQAEEGMTWEEWCNSSYNTDGYSISGTDVQSPYGRIYNDGNLTSPVISTDIIISGKQYSDSGSGGVGN